jgi:hypothetical protein
MPATHPSKTLYRIDECPDLMADGCVGDENGNLVFLSIWARDTAVQEFLARLTLGGMNRGWTSSMSSPSRARASRFSSATSRTWRSASPAPTAARCSAH